MGVRTEAIPQRGRRLPIAVVVAAVLAFAGGTALGALVAHDTPGQSNRRAVIVVPLDDGMPDPATSRITTRRRAAEARGLETMSATADGAAPAPGANLEPRIARERASDLAAALLRNQMRRG
jgi:hypothetical protein